MNIIKHLSRMLGIQVTPEENGMVSIVQEPKDSRKRETEGAMLERIAIYNTTSEHRRRKEELRNTRRETEAVSRRRLAREWERAAHNNGYRVRSAQESCVRTTQKIADELFDGIFLNLNERNNKKSPNVQKRILRRTVEKRQAQATHRNACKGSRENRFVAHMHRRNTGYCMSDLYRLQCAC